MSADVINAKANGAGGGKAADFHPDLAVIRTLSTVLPGPLPLAVNGVRVAASIRPRKFVIEGGDDTPVTMPRSAFQIVYPDCSVMIDSGLDKATQDAILKAAATAEARRTGPSRITPSRSRSCSARSIRRG